MLKKHYHNLLKSLPDDYMVTIGKLCESGVAKDNDQTVNTILSWPNAKFVNKKILEFLIGCIENDEHVFTFCERMETIVNNMAVVHAVRDGKLVCSYVCTVYVYSTSWCFKI